MSTPHEGRYITHEHGKWIVHAEDGKVLGEHDTEEEAKKQLAAVEAHKHDRDALPSLERRFVPLAEGFEVRMMERDGKNMICGYGAVFNSRSQVMYTAKGSPFVERIRPGAFRRAIAEADVRALLNHDPNKILGRRGAGTLRVVEDELGLPYEIDPPDVSYARDLAVSLGRRDITGSSFSFATVEDDWSMGEDGIAIRELRDVHLFDVGPVTFPAYPATSAGRRSLAPDDPACRSYERFVERRAAEQATEEATPPPAPWQPSPEQVRTLQRMRLALLSD